MKVESSCHGASYFLSGMGCKINLTITVEDHSLSDKDNLDDQLADITSVHVVIIDLMILPPSYQFYLPQINSLSNTSI